MLALMCDLKELSLRENTISDIALSNLANGATNLEVLDISRCKVGFSLTLYGRSLESKVSVLEDCDMCVAR